MIATLIRQDLAFRRLHVWLLVALAWASAMAMMVAWIVARREPLEAQLVAVMIWFCAALYLVFGEIQTRTNPFNLSLPISARTLWLSHFIAVSIAGLAILTVSGAVTIGSLYLIGKLKEGWLVDPKALVRLGGFLVTGYVLAIGMVHAFRTGDQNVPLSFRRVGWSLLAAFVPVGLAALLQPLGTVGVLVVLILAVGVVTHVFRAVPVVLSVSPDRRRAAADDADVAGPESWATTQQAPGLWSALRIVHGVTTCAKKPIAMWVILPFLLFMGFWVSGIDTRWTSESMRFALPYMIVYVFMVVTNMSITGLGVIDWLPWSRRRSLALLTMPVFLAVVIGYGAGRVVDTVLGERTVESLCFVEDRETEEPRFCVSLGASRISWNGDIPEISTAAGETVTPWNRPVFRGLPMRMYFPHYAPVGSSKEFTARQISGAAGALYGVDIPPEEIRTRYLDVAGEGVPELTLQADYGLSRTGHGVYFPWLMAGVVVFWSLLTAAYTHWLRGGVSEKKRKFMAAVFVAIPMLCWIFDFVLEITDLSEISIRNAFIINLARSAGDSVAGTIAVWLGSALIAWAAYRLAERRFERAELSMKPIARQGHEG
jgi:hypothetical protein